MVSPVIVLTLAIQAHYKLTSTVMLQLTTHKSSESKDEQKEKDKSDPESWKREGEVTLSGSMTRQVSTG